MPPLVTVGHGRLDQPALAVLLRQAEVARVVDIRRFPASRAHPQVRREALEIWLPQAGIDYRWEPRLGGRRTAVDADTDAWWKVRAFRAYAAHLRQPEARAALAAVFDEAATARTAVMCSETPWWRCHRRLVADTAVLVHRVEVLHLDHGGHLRAHEPCPGAVLREDSSIVYPAPPAGTELAETAPAEAALTESAPAESASVVIPPADATSRPDPTASNQDAKTRARRRRSP